MDDTDSKPERQRATSPEVLANKQTRVMVSGFIARLGEWQKELAFLEARAAKNETSDLRRRRTELRADLNRERKRFDALISDLPPKLKTHSRVVDVLRAMDRLIERLGNRDGQERCGTAQLPTHPVPSEPAGLRRTPPTHFLGNMALAIP